MYGMDFVIISRLCLVIFFALAKTAASLAQTAADVSVSVKSTHYKMAVGQGECSLTVSEISKNATRLKIAVFADLGSSSFQTDPKYGATTYVEKAIFREARHGRERGEKTAVNISIPLSIPTQVPDREVSSDSVASITGGASIQKEVEECLQEYLQGTEYWFVFLSHPDKDHINYLAKTFEKFSKVRMSLVAGGDWYSNPTKEMREIFAMLQKYKDRIVWFFPYEKARATEAQVDELFVSDKKEDAIISGEAASFNPRNKIGGIFLDEFQGTFKDCLERVYRNLTYSPGSSAGAAAAATTPPQQTLYEKFWAVINVPDSDRALIEKHVLEKIYFLSLDYRLGDANAQSLVWFHAVDDLGWTFVYTGDAEPATLEKVCNKVKKSEMQCVLRGDSGKNLVMLQGMHHGSRENFPDKGNHPDKVKPFIELINPHAVCFSAGNGASFAHPHYDAIKRYRASVNSTEFWARYLQSDRHYKFTAFTESGKRTGYAVKPKKKTPLLLCTNTYGTVKIDAQGMFVKDLGLEGYVMYDSLHAYEITGEPESLTINDLPENEKLKEGVSLEYQRCLDELRDKLFSWKKEENLYTQIGNDKFKLKRVEKENKYYLYVLEKLLDEPATASELGIAAAASA